MHLQFNTPPSTSPEPPSWTQILLAGCKPLSLSSCGVPHLHPVLVKTYFMSMLVFQAALSPQQLTIGNPDMQFCQSCHNYATQRPLSTLAELKAIFEALTTIERVPWEQSQPVVILRLNRSCTRPLENTPPSTHILNIPCKDYNAWAQRTSTPGHRQVDGCRHICLLWFIYYLYFQLKELTFDKYLQCSTRALIPLCGCNLPGGLIHLKKVALLRICTDATFTPAFTHTWPLGWHGLFGPTYLFCSMLAPTTDIHHVLWTCRGLQCS